MTLALEMRGITKRFPGVTANDQVDFQLAAGEIHALLGENGAGKTTLMHMLYGLSRPDEGKIVIHGTPVRLRSPSDAMTHGIGMVHQHFMLVPVLTVTENIILGQEDARWGPWPRPRLRKRSSQRSWSARHVLRTWCNRHGRVLETSSCACTTCRYWTSVGSWWLLACR